ncbi:hypothetical protein HYD56_01410 [Mycoplasmopsis bovis]|nr:hypothetical protein [Mycoplasmopsis bovis]QQH66559.1 hypothetical protein HYD56_01410 [Mycoplasmopsis bovis]
MKIATLEILVAIKALELKQLQSFRTEKKLRLLPLKRNTTLIRAEKLDENFPKIKDKQLLGLKSK